MGGELGNESKIAVLLGSSATNAFVNFRLDRERRFCSEVV